MLALEGQEGMSALEEGKGKGRKDRKGKGYKGEKGETKKRKRYGDVPTEARRRANLFTSDLDGAGWEGYYQGWMCGYWGGLSDAKLMGEWEELGWRYCNTCEAQHAIWGLEKLQYRFFLVLNGLDKPKA